MTSRVAAWRTPLAMGLTAASGFAGLGYQIVWTRQGALWLGHESAAVLAVVAAFFGGLAVGALLFGSRIERSRRPLRWVAGSECVIGLWGLLLVGAMPLATDRLLEMIGTQPTPVWQWTVAFVGTFGLMLPATAAMGATLPALERALSDRRGEARSIAGLYACNTFGATLGVLCAAFWLVPSIGLSGTTLICVALNGSCALLALLLARSARPADRVTQADARDVRSTAVLSRLGCTGLLGIGYEVVVVRVLSQVCEDTVYTFALLLAVYLVGSAAGAWGHRRWLDRSTAVDGTTTDRLLVALALACLVGGGSLWFADAIKARWIDLWGDGLVVAITAEAALATAAFALPTVVMGALFSHLAAVANARGVPFGRAFGINIVGAAIAPLVFGVVLAPTIGSGPTLLGIVAGYLLLTGRRAWTRPIVVAPAVATVAALLVAPSLAFVDVPDGGRVVRYREGVAAAVSVVEDDAGVLRLRIDNRQQEGSSATRQVDARQALIPLLLHPAPHRALFLGLGTGVTASSAAEEPGLEVDAVELLPEVIDASSLFTRAIANGASDPRLHLIAADARRYVRTATTRYDLIVADNFHPARSGSGALYTVEHFTAIRERLADDGLFCQWLPLHQLDLDTLRSVVRSFVAVYPDGWALLASNSLGTPVVGLVARRDGRRFDAGTVAARLAASRLPLALGDFGLDDGYALLGSFVAGPRALARFAGEAALNTDDHPVVAYRAPWVTYAPQSLPQDRLVALLQAVSISADELLVADGDPSTARRLSAYWSARDRFIDAGRGVRVSADVQRMLAQVREPLLAVLRTSPDFRPAREPLLRMATALARTDRAAAEALLAELDGLRPGRDDDPRARGMPSPTR